MKFSFSVEDELAEIEGSGTQGVGKPGKPGKTASTLPTLPTLPSAPASELPNFRAIGFEEFTGMDAPARIEARREALEEMMTEDDEPRTYYFLTDTESYSDYVVLAMAKRGVATWEFYIEPEKYKYEKLLELIQKIERKELHGETTQ